MQQPSRTPGETNATIAGRMIARTNGYPAEPGDTRFRCRVARVGARIVDLVDTDSGVEATLAEIRRNEWVVVTLGAVPVEEGVANGPGSSFTAAVAVAYVLYAEPSTDT